MSFTANPHLLLAASPATQPFGLATLPSAHSLVEWLASVDRSPMQCALPWSLTRPSALTCDLQRASSTTARSLRRPQVPLHARLVTPVSAVDAVAISLSPARHGSRVHRHGSRHRHCSMLQQQLRSMRTTDKQLHFPQNLSRQSMLVEERQLSW